MKVCNRNLSFLCACLLALGTVPLQNALAAGSAKGKANQAKIFNYCADRSMLSRLNSEINELQSASDEVKNSSGDADLIKSMLSTYAKRIKSIKTQMANLKKSSKNFIADLNSDGVVDQNDVDLTASCDANAALGKPLDPRCSKADLNGDGAITGADVSLVASAKVCYEENYPVGKGKNQC